MFSDKIIVTLVHTKFAVFFLACRAGIFCSVNDDTIDVLPQPWALKLTQNWSESKKLFQGEGLSGQNRGGEGARTGALPPCPLLSTDFFICFQYDCRDQCTSELPFLSSAVLLRRFTIYKISFSLQRGSITNTTHNKFLFFRFLLCSLFVAANEFQFPQCRFYRR